MKKIFGLLLFISVAFISGAQKTIHDANATARTVSSFHAISVSNAFDVIITQGSEEGLAVSARYKEDINNIKTSVENGVLKIWYDTDMKNVQWGKDKRLKAYIAVKNLDEIKASGATNINLEGNFKATSLKLRLSGASDLKGDIAVDGKLYINMSGASDLKITGYANDVEIDASGASDVKGYDFKANTCSVDASGASDVRITVDKEVSAKLSGASSLHYKGSALMRDVKTNGSSSISRKSR